MVKKGQTEKKAQNHKDRDRKIFEENWYATANTTVEKVKSLILKDPSLDVKSPFLKDLVIILRNLS